jgi:hypothetical protein
MKEVNRKAGRYTEYVHTLSTKRFHKYVMYRKECWLETGRACY